MKLPTLIEQQAYRDAAEGLRPIEDALTVIHNRYLRSELRKSDS